MVGDNVESEYAGAGSAGVVTEVLTGSKFAADGARMRPKGQTLDARCTLDAKDTFGSWTLSAVADNTRTDGANWQVGRRWVHYNGKSQTGQDNVYIRGKSGTHYWGWKAK